MGEAKARRAAAAAARAAAEHRATVISGVHNMILERHKPEIVQAAIDALNAGEGEGTERSSFDLLLIAANVVATAVGMREPEEQRMLILAFHSIVHDLIQATEQHEAGHG